MTHIFQSFFLFSHPNFNSILQFNATIYFQSLSLVQERGRYSRLSNAALFMSNKVRQYIPIECVYDCVLFEQTFFFALVVFLFCFGFVWFVLCFGHGSYLINNEFRIEIVATCVVSFSFIFVCFIWNQIHFFRKIF